MSMRHSLTHFTAVLVVLFLGGNQVARGADKPTAKDLGKIQPPGGAPLLPGEPGTEISVDFIKQANKRLESAPAKDLDRWVAELERITGKKLSSELEDLGCRTYFVTRMSLAFDNLTWNARAADKLFQRARAMPASEAKVWTEAFAALLKDELGRAYAVPLVLIPVEALHQGQKYTPQRGKKYRARLKQLTADDVSLWKRQVDKSGGTKLDAAVNLILLDEYFDKEVFQRDRLKAAIGARKK